MRFTIPHLISSIPNIIYYTGYSGFSETEREAFLLITKKRKFIITDSRYSQDLKKIKGFEVFEIPAKRFLKNGHSQILKKLRIKQLGIEANNLTVSEYNSLRKSVKLVPVDLSRLREIKQTEEIKNIKKACKIGDMAFEYLVKQIRLGVTEKELGAKLEMFIKNKNADISFKPIIAFGKNSAIPHHVPNSTKLKKNQIVLLDFGVKINNYCSDMSRTVFFGKAPEEFKKMHQVVLEAQEKAIEFMNGQLFARDIDKVARDYIAKLGYPDIIHSVGHGIGIEVHESPTLSPDSKDIIKNGMVFSVEPGIYVPGFGGVRIEDLVLVREGYAQLISNARREIIELHA